MSDVVITAVTALLASLIGGGVSIATTLMVNRQNVQLALFERTAQSIVKRDEMQLEDLRATQVAARQFVMASTKMYLSIRDRLPEGALPIQVEVDDSIDLEYRDAAAEFTMLTGRILDDDLRTEAVAIRQLATAIWMESQSATELEVRYLRFCEAFPPLEDHIGQCIRSLTNARCEPINSHSLKA